MSDVVASTEGSDVLRLSALFNRILGEEKISLSLPVQLLCDAMIGARPDFLLAVNAQGTILFASSACSELAGVSCQALQGEAFETLLDMEDRPSFRSLWRILSLGEAICKIRALRCAHCRSAKHRQTRFIGRRCALAQ